MELVGENRAKDAAAIATQSSRDLLAVSINILLLRTLELVVPPLYRDRLCVAAQAPTKSARS